MIAMHAPLRLFAVLALCAPSVLANPSVRVVGLFQDAAVVTIDGERQMLRVGQPPRNGVELLAADSRSATLKIAGQTRVLSVEADFSSPAAEPERQRVSIPRTAGGHYRITGSINGHSVPFMVDTGATSVAMNAQYARRLGIDYRLTGTLIQATTASGRVAAYRVRLDRVKVGEIELTNVEGLVLDGPFPEDVLLGMSWLGRVRMDDQHTTLVLERRY
jgi:aspartyl protease family protein